MLTLCLKLFLLLSAFLLFLLQILQLLLITDQLVYAIDTHILHLFWWALLLRCRRFILFRLAWPFCYRSRLFCLSGDSLRTILSRFSGVSNSTVDGLLSEFTIATCRAVACSSRHTTVSKISVCTYRWGLNSRSLGSMLNRLSELCKLSLSPRHFIYWWVRSDQQIVINV